MELLETQEMVGIPSPYISHVEPFDQIIERDESEDKKQASKELAYIHFLVHWDSPYASYPKDRRPEKIIKDIFGEDSGWKPDDLVVEGVNKYEELTASEYTRLLAGAREAANKLVTHFETVDLDDPRDAKDAINNISKVGDVVEGIDKLKEQIEKHESRNNANRAGAKTNKYSEGD